MEEAPELQFLERCTCTVHRNGPVVHRCYHERGGLPIARLVWLVDGAIYTPYLAIQRVLELAKAIVELRVILLCSSHHMCLREY